MGAGSAPAAASGGGGAAAAGVCGDDGGFYIGHRDERRALICWQCQVAKKGKDLT